MGIRGLMSYIREYPNLLEKYFLHGEYLVIDGHSLAAKLYEMGPGNTVFGGDYDSYPHTVEKFFDELQKCDVESFVILNGGDEIMKKHQNIVDRKEKKLKPVINFTPATRDTSRIVPLSLMIVFNSVLKKKGVKLVRCLGQADPHIAGIAKALNCPVLTFDSQFFVYGVQVVPFDSLRPSIQKSSSNEGSWTKECNLYKPEVLSKSFNDLSISMFPLLTIILGNSYIDETIFEKFLNSLICETHYPHQLGNAHKKIEAILLWLQNYNIHEAIAALLEIIPKERRREAKRIIENIIDQHINLPCDLLKTLGLNEKYEVVIREKLVCKKFELLEKIDDHEKKNETWREEKTFESDNSDEEKDEEREKMKIYNDMGKLNDMIVKSWPSWFTREFENAETPSYYINMMLHRFFHISFCVENWYYPSAMEMSLKIVRVIDGLLVAGQRESSLSLMLLIREKKKIVTRLIDPLHGTKTTKFPPLVKLRETPMEIRKKIFDDTLEMSSKEIADLPDKWKLYFAVILFWMGQKDEPLRNSCDLKAVIFMMLFGVIDDKIGYHRSEHTLRRSIKEFVENEQDNEAELQEERRGESIEDAIKKVTENDCLNAASFFIQNYYMDHRLQCGTGKFNVTTVHVFMQFEACLKHAIHLNRLLECPYENPKIEQLCNATFYYNLSEKFASQRNVENFIATTLNNVPSLLHLVNLLIAKAQNILDARSKVSLPN